MTKQIIIHVECCKECTNFEQHEGMRRIGFCLVLCRKKVKGDEIDKECPLPDVEWL